MALVFASAFASCVLGQGCLGSFLAGPRQGVDVGAETQLTSDPFEGCVEVSGQGGRADFFLFFNGATLECKVVHVGHYSGQDVILFHDGERDVIVAACFQPGGKMSGFTVHSFVIFFTYQSPGCSEETMLCSIVSSSDGTW